MSQYFLLQKIVDAEKAKANLENRSIDTDLVTKKFQEVVNDRFNNEDFVIF